MIDKLYDAKDKIGIEQLEVVIKRLQFLLVKADANIGKVRPIIDQQDIELVKDHLDLVVKYTRL